MPRGAPPRSRDKLPPTTGDAPSAVEPKSEPLWLQPPQPAHAVGGADEEG